MRWSERQGLREVRTLQTDGMDERLRIRLWNALQRSFLANLDTEEWANEDGFNYSFMAVKEKYQEFLADLWDTFARPLDTLPKDPREVVTAIKRWFAKCDWLDTYDILVFCVQHLPQQEAEDLARTANTALDGERSPWRFTRGMLTRRLGEAEEAAVDGALDASEPYPEIGQQLRNALRMFSSRLEPDYPNCIKEAISAVETLTKMISGNPNADMGAAMRVIRGKKLIPIHACLTSGMEKLYLYACEEARHGLKPGQERTPDVADAQYMLATCSACISYLISKATDAGVLPTSLQLQETTSRPDEIA